MTPRPHSSAVRAEPQGDVRREVVFQQLDNLNALGDALATASRNGDAAQLATVRASLDRFGLAMGWNAEAVLPAILAYVEEHAEFDDELFGPAFVLSRIAPGHERTAVLLARLPQVVRDLLAVAGAG